ncbi:ABC transporter ATP-binding protein [Streptomyces millisiae]|uniref:ABC transporter ATP-binding protein n=1 Tax=Streptomyces millisiae TaxID=3075542 RepID=A0ABU2LJ17_9ACTN|nr:ABC transporter ATP-binding protein [Streptomyces sp. DSM 44918]MDT0317569.1 ABC transporter ATP-binding protein [Streptomyces sp. DSM 44918]
MSLLSVTNLTVAFAGAARPAVRDASFEVRPGEIVGLVGESGSGKSTTGLAVLGLHDPRTTTVTGSVTLDGRELVGADEKTLRAIRGRRVAMIFQDALDALNPYRRVGEQIAEAYRLHHADADRATARARAVELLTRVGIDRPEERARQYPHQFSGGMRQRVMIALALVNEPELLIADEPTTALDATVQAQVLGQLVRLQRETGIGVVLITHDFGVVAQVCDRVAVMYRGRLVEQGPTERVLTAGTHPYTRALVASVPRPDDEPGTRLPTVPEVVATLVGELDEEALADPTLRVPPPAETAAPGGEAAGAASAPAGSAGRAAGRGAAVPAVSDGSDALAPGGGEAASPEAEAASATVGGGAATAAPRPKAGPASASPGEARSAAAVSPEADAAPLLVVRDLTVSYPGRLGRPRQVAVRGVSFEIAAGETFGLVGESGSGKSTISRVLLGPRRPDSGTVSLDGEDVTHASRRARRRLAPRVQMVFQDPYGSLNPDRRIGDTVGAGLAFHTDLGRAERRARVAGLLAEVGLDPDLATAYPDALSGGMRQRVGIARALALEPRLLVADEPVSALDVSVQAQVLNLLTELQRRRGLAMLFISHDLTVVRHMSSRIAVLRAGEIVESGDRDQIMEHPESDYTRALLDAGHPAARRAA